MTNIYVLIALTFLFTACKEEDGASQESLRQEIQTAIADKSCEKDTDCGVIMLGNDGRCGNPTDFWAYSLKKSDNAKVTALVEKERTAAAKAKAEEAKKIQESGGMMGICGFPSRAAGCINKQCAVSPH